LLLFSFVGCYNPIMDNLLKPWTVKPLITDLLSPGLYDCAPEDLTLESEPLLWRAAGDEEESTHANDVDTAMDYVNLNADTYTLLIDENVSADSHRLSQNVNLTIVGKGAPRTIQHTGATFLFILDDPASLTLGNNITLRGTNDSERPLVRMTTGTFTMLVGSKITGHTNGADNGAVYVNGGSFVMEGGEISGNRTPQSSGPFSTGGLYVASNSTVRISGGRISGNTDTNGSLDIYISQGSSFTLSGNAAIGTLTLGASATTNSSITIDKAYTGSATLNLYGNNNDIATVIGWWENKAVITGSPTASDIGRFTLGRFICNTPAENRSIRDADCSIVSSGVDIGKLVRTFTLPLRNVADIEPYLSQQSGGNGPTDPPIPLSLQFDLGTMTDTNSNWQKILAALNTAGKYVDLNLSACIIEGGASKEFNPAPNGPTSAQIGQERIVSLTLPTVAESIPVGVAGPRDRALFGRFTNLISLIGPGLKTTGNYAFANTELTKVELPAVISIGSGAFQSGLFTQITLTLPSTLTSIGNNAFNYCNYLTEIALPSTLTTIGSNTFEFCTSLTTVDLPAVTSIGVEAFINCTSLTTVNMPKVTSISNDAFKGCESLAQITLPASLTYLGIAFPNCTNLKTVTCLATNPPTLENSAAFYNVHPELRIEVPAGSVNAYKTAPEWDWWGEEDKIFAIGTP
jgi:hypothetical protein